MTDTAMAAKHILTVLAVLLHRQMVNLPQVFRWADMAMTAGYILIVLAVLLHRQMVNHLPQVFRWAEAAGHILTVLAVLLLGHMVNLHEVFKWTDHGYGCWTHANSIHSSAAQVDSESPSGAQMG